jgi:hypothetical protein
MSAYICSEHHIKSLAAYLVAGPNAYPEGIAARLRQMSSGVPIPNGEKHLASLFAAVLMRENYASVNHLYPNSQEEAPATLEVNERFLLEAKDLSPIAVIRSVECYRYQACEHPEWEDSLAAWLSAEIIFLAVKDLPDLDRANWGSPKMDSDTPPAETKPADNVVSLASMARRLKAERVKPLLPPTDPEKKAEPPAPADRCSALDEIIAFRD